MRRRISLLVAAMTTAVVVSFVVPLCLLVRVLAEDRALAAANQEARNIALQVSTFDTPSQLRQVVATADQASPAHSSVLLANGTVLGSPAPGMATDPGVARARGGEGFTERTDDGARVLLPVVSSQGTDVVMTVIEPAEFHRGVLRAWLAIIGVGAALLAAALVIADRIGRRTSQPLRDVAEVAHQLRGGDMTARAVPEGTSETVELAEALNGLAERIDDLLTAERAAIADLSHRLRTPVTALRLDAEQVPDERLSNQLQGHITALQRDIDAIVHEARRPLRRDSGGICNAAEVVAERVRFWSALAEDQSRELTTDITEQRCLVSLPESDLRDLVDIVIDNVFAHTDEGVDFAVSLTRKSHRIRLVVQDAGPGMSAGAPSGSRVGSTGLGLDIARRTASAGGGSLTAGDAQTGGAIVQVDLPEAVREVPVKPLKGAKHRH